MFGLGIPIFNWRITSPINVVWKLPIDNTNIIHTVFRPLDAESLLENFCLLVVALSYVLVMTLYYGLFDPELM